MRTATIATFVALAFCFALFADPVPECSRAGAWGDRAVPHDIAMDDDFVYQADARGLSVYDIRNPAAIRRTAFLATVHPSVAVAIRGSRIALLTRGSLELYAIEPQGSVRHLDSEAVEAADVAFADAGIVTGGAALSLWGYAGDILARRGSAVLSDGGTRVAVHGNDVFVASHPKATAVYRINSNGSFTRTGVLATPAFDLLVDGDTLYIGGGDSGLVIVDLRGDTPIVAGRLATAESTIRRLAKAGNEIFAADGMARLAIIDVSDPARPSFTTHLDVPVEVIAARGNRIALAGDLLTLNRIGSVERMPMGSPLRLFDASTRSESGRFEDFAGLLSGVATDGRYVYVADPPVMRVIDAADPAAPREVARVTYGDGSRLARLDGNRLLLWGVGNAHLFDVSDPRRPLYHGGYRSLGIWPEGATFAGPFVIEANRASGFHVLDVSVPGTFRQVGGLRNDGYGAFRGVEAIPGVAYALLPTGVKVVDIAADGRPTVVAWISVPAVADAAIAESPSGPRLVILDDDRLRVFDLTDPLDPKERGSVTAMRAEEITADGETVWLVARSGAIMRVDVSSPATPRITHAYDGLALPTQVAAHAGLVAVADGTQLTLLRDFAAEGLAPLTIRSGHAAARSAAVAWDVVPGAVAYEIAVAGEPTFAAPQLMLTTTPGAWIAYADASQWVRVRPRNGCATANWSNILEIRPSAAGDVVFSQSAETLVVRSGESRMTAVSLENRGNASRRVSLAVTGTDVTAGDAITIPPGSSAVIPLTVAGSATREITLGLRDADGTPLPASMRLRVKVVEATAAPRSASPARLIIPGVGSTAGSVGTQWKSDLQIFARETTALRLRYAPFGAGTVAQAVDFTLDEGQVVIIEDVIASLFGATGTNGVLEIEPERPESIDAAAVTYNDAAAGPYGERLAALRPPAGSGTRSSVIAGILNDETARTNVAVIETGGAPATVVAQLHDADGGLIASGSRQLAAWESIQLPLGLLLSELPPTARGTLTLVAPAAVVAYASRVDQVSGDATITVAASTEPAVVPWSPRPRYRASFDAAGSVRGAAGSDWKTAIAISNPSAAAADVTLTFFPAVDPGRAIAHVVRVPAHGALATDDLATGLFASAPAELMTLGTLVAESDIPLASWGWLYNTTARGRFGQSLPARDVSHARTLLHTSHPEDLTPVKPRPLTVFPLAENANVRTNLGLIETSGRTARVRVLFRDAGGALAGSIERDLPPFGSILIGSALREAGLADAEGVRGVLETTDSGVMIFASRVDARSGDAYFIGGRP